MKDTNFQSPCSIDWIGSTPAIGLPDVPSAIFRSGESPVLPQALIVSIANNLPARQIILRVA